MTFEKQADILDRRVRRCHAILQGRREHILRLAADTPDIKRQQQWYEAQRRLNAAQEARRQLDRQTNHSPPPGGRFPHDDGDIRLVEQGARSQQSIDWAGEEEERHA